MGTSGRRRSARTWNQDQAWIITQQTQIHTLSKEVEKLRKQLKKSLDTSHQLRAELQDTYHVWGESTPTEDLLDHLTTIPTVDMPKSSPVQHEWRLDMDKAGPVDDWAAHSRSLFAQFDVDLNTVGVIEKQIGWWIRIPLAWWLSFKRLFTPSSSLEDR